MDVIQNSRNGLGFALDGFLKIAKWYIFGVGAQIAIMLISVPAWLLGGFAIGLGAPTWAAVAIGICVFIGGLAGFGYLIESNDQSTSSENKPEEVKTESA